MGKRYHFNLSDYFKSQPLFFDGDLEKKPNIRKCMEQPWQQTKAELWDEVTGTLCSLDFIQAKAVAKKTYDLVKDFSDVLEVIPDNAENIRQEKIRQERMDKYSRDLIAYAKGEIKEMEIPETIPLWSEKEINAEIRRMKTNPTRADKLKDFVSFLGQEAGNLQNYSREFSHFALQQAWNYANSGTVADLAEKTEPVNFNSLVRCCKSCRPSWNPLSQVVFTLRGYKFPVRCVAITPDGKRAISGSERGECIVWNIDTGQAINTLKEHTHGITKVVITPDGKRAITGSDDKTCIIWDIDTGQAINTLWGHTSGISCVAITPDGKRAISGSEDQTCIVWNLDYYHPAGMHRGHTSIINAAAISSDGKKAITGSGDNNCITWDLETGEIIHIMKGHFSGVNAIAVSPDNKIAVSGSDDKSCIIWDISAGQALSILNGHNSGFNNVAITPDGTRAVSGSNSASIIWDIDTGKAIHIINQGTFRTCLTPDGKQAIFISTTFSGYDDCYEMNMLELNTGRVTNCGTVHFKKVFDVKITPDGKTAVSISADRTCKIVNLCTGREIHTLNGNRSAFLAVDITPDGKKALIGTSDNTCIIWDLKNGQVIHILKGHTDQVNTVAITPDGKRAISGSADKTLIVWNMERGEKLGIYVNTTSDINSVFCFSNGVFSSEKSGNVFIVNANKEFIRPEKSIVTIRRIWNFEMEEFLASSADCPLCGHRFAPPASVLSKIEEITKKAGLTSEQSPCLELPDEAWEHPGLLGECPDCREKLKFNPFITGGD